MLTTAVQCTEIVTHIYNLLANQASRFVLQELGLLEMLDNHIYINSSLHNPSKSYDQNLNPILVENKFTCTFDIKHASTGLIWDNNTTRMYMDATRHRRDGYSRIPLLVDKKHGIVLYDSVLPMNLPMNCTLSLRDYTQAHEVIDRFHLKFNQGELVAVTNLSYDFPLPLEILKTLWALAHTAGISKKCFPEWLKQYSNGNIKRIVTKGLNKEHVEWVVKRQVFEALIKIDYDQSEPEKEGAQQSETLGVNFTLTLQCSRPSVLYVDYPLVINNTLVPEEVIHVDTTYQHELYKFLQHPTLSVDPAYQLTIYREGGPARNPWYDDWQVPKYNSLHASLNSRPFFIGLFTLDLPECDKCPCPNRGTPYNECACCPHHKDDTPYDPERMCPCYCGHATTDIDITQDLDMYQIKQKLLDYYAERKDKCLNIEDVYNIAVFVDDVQMNRSLLQFDGKILKVSNRLGPNHIYRLVLSFTPPRHMDQAQREPQGDDPWHPIGPQMYQHPFLFYMDCIIVPKREGVT